MKIINSAALQFPKPHSPCPKILLYLFQSSNSTKKTLEQDQSAHEKRHFQSFFKSSILKKKFAKQSFLFIFLLKIGPRKCFSINYRLKCIYIRRFKNFGEATTAAVKKNSTSVGNNIQTDLDEQFQVSEILFFTADGIRIILLNSQYGDFLALLTLNKSIKTQFADQDDRFIQRKYSPQ